MTNTEYRNGFGDGVFGVGAFGLDGSFKNISGTASASLTSTITVIRVQSLSSAAVSSALTNSITVNRVQSSSGASTIALVASCTARKLWEAISEGLEAWTDSTEISTNWTDRTSTSTTWTEAA